MLISPWRRLHRRHTCWRTGRRNTARNRFGQPSNQTACRPGSRGTAQGQDHLILQKWLSLKNSNQTDDYCCAEKKTPPCSRGSRTRASASLCKKDPRNINLRKPLWGTPSHTKIASIFQFDWIISYFDIVDRLFHGRSGWLDQLFWRQPLILAKVKSTAHLSWILLV